mmetsp:Transcript_40730/g.122988  ORF Transcript_40730/g.122988 Transcript_40730/m.122988 type:complete len:453 (-) Transcript_40730:199-1557(-)
MAAMLPAVWAALGLFMGGMATEVPCQGAGGASGSCEAPPSFDDPALLQASVKAHEHAVPRRTTATKINEETCTLEGAETLPPPREMDEQLELFERVRGCVDGPCAHSILVTRVTVPANSRSPLHVHSNAGVSCIVKGSVTVFVADVQNGQTYVAGDCYRLPLNAPVAVVNQGPDVAKMLKYIDRVWVEWENRRFKGPHMAFICEQPPAKGMWDVGYIVCESCIKFWGEACKLYKSCNGEDATLDWSQPCLRHCRINGAPPPMEYIDMPPAPKGISVNAGKRIPMTPSWPLIGKHSGEIQDFSVGSGRIIVERTIRLPGTRSVTHAHDFGGVTCLQEGEMTLLLDKVDSLITKKAGECYWMPGTRFMSGMNTGNVTTLMWDMFSFPDEYRRGFPILALHPKETFTESADLKERSFCACMKAPAVDQLLPGQMYPCNCTAMQGTENATLYYDCP